MAITDNGDARSATSAWFPVELLRSIQTFASLANARFKIPALNCNSKHSTFSGRLGRYQQRSGRIRFKRNVHFKNPPNCDAKHSVLSAAFASNGTFAQRRRSQRIAAIAHLLDIRFNRIVRRKELAPNALRKRSTSANLRSRRIVGRRQRIMHQSHTLPAHGTYIAEKEFRNPRRLQPAYARPQCAQGPSFRGLDWRRM